MRFQTTTKSPLFLTLWCCPLLNVTWGVFNLISDSRTKTLKTIGNYKGDMGFVFIDFPLSSCFCLFCLKAKLMPLIIICKLSHLFLLSINSWYSSNLFILPMFYYFRKK